MDGWEGELCRGVGFSGLALSPLGHWSLRSGPSAPRDVSTTVHQHVLFFYFLEFIQKDFLRSMLLFDSHIPFPPWSGGFRCAWLRSESGPSASRFFLFSGLADSWSSDVALGNRFRHGNED